MRDLVKKGYNTNDYAKVYSRNVHFDSFEKLFCDELLSRMKGPKLCDLGCGTGVPYDSYFVKNGCHVSGIDISEKHISQAKKNVNADYKVGDFFDMKRKFDAVISLYAIFHIPRSEHKKLFRHIHGLLKKEGHILITLGSDSMRYSEQDFAGSPMAWSSYSVQHNKKILEESGFRIIIACEDYRTERHLWVLAKKC